jgi:hypothetical protein
MNRCPLLRWLAARFGPYRERPCVVRGCSGTMRVHHYSRELLSDGTPRIDLRCDTCGRTRYAANRIL